MSKPKIKFVLDVDHSYPPLSAPHVGPDGGYSTARLRVCIRFTRSPGYGTPWRTTETSEIASKRFDWGHGVGADDCEEQAAKWAAEGLATTLKKLWPENG